MIKRRKHQDDPFQVITEVLRSMGENGEKLVIGIDPGKEGALAFLPVQSRWHPLLIDLPFDVIERDTTRPIKTTDDKKKRKKVKRKQKHYDMQTLALWFDPVIDFNNAHGGSLRIALERTAPMPGDSSVTAFGMGLGYGMWHLFFAAFGLSYVELQPAAWKRKMGLLKQGKDAGRVKAKKMFPSAAEYLRCKGDHNRADALLIAEVARQQWE